MTRAFLIGAGATKAQYDNAPLSYDFFNKLRSNYNPFFSAINQSISKYIKNMGPLEKLNVEDVMKLSYDFPDVNRTSFLDSLHSSIYRLLVNSTQSDPGYFQSYVKGEQLTHPTLFLNLLNDSSLNKEDFFMTLNYDLYLDREILYRQQKINYGITKDNYKQSKITVVNEAELSLYHLHGSLNWNFVGDNKININNGAIIPQYRGGSNICLVPPGVKKLEEPVLKSIWSIAKKRLLKSDELIIIGCSLNLEDTELINLIKGFVDKKGSDKIKIIYLKDQNSQEFEKNYKEVFGDNYKRYHHGFNLEAIEFLFDRLK